jgi:hypothetical protein
VRLALAAALLCALVFAPSAHAYKRLSHTFPTRTITYYDGTGGRYSKEIKAAAGAWNKSGSKVRWTKASKSKARVPIIVKNLPVAGLGWYFGNGRGRIDLAPNIKKGQLTKLAGEGVATQVVVHEMGHVMGLDHETKKCAVMQPSIGLGCKRPKEIWRFRCRLLEKDDIAGGVKLFGGKIGKVGPEYCDAVKEPAAPTGLTVGPAPPDDGGETSGTTQVTWTTPKGSDLESVRVMRRKDVCPTGADDEQADLVGQDEALPGKVQSVSDPNGFPANGRYCYSVQAFGKFQRPGKTATVEYDHTGPLAPGFAPTADYEWDLGSDDGRTIRFTDYSEPADNAGGELVSWRWDFADGQFSDERNPIHTFAPGEYSVTLTVTDSQGRTAFVTRTISVTDETEFR